MEQFHNIYWFNKCYKLNQQRIFVYILVYTHTQHTLYLNLIIKVIKNRQCEFQLVEILHLIHAENKRQVDHILKFCVSKLNFIYQVNLLWLIEIYFPAKILLQKNRSKFSGINSQSISIYIVYMQKIQCAKQLTCFASYKRSCICAWRQIMDIYCSKFFLYAWFL